MISPLSIPKIPDFQVTLRISLQLLTRLITRQDLILCMQEYRLVQSDYAGKHWSRLHLL